jgi:hypothetical protein
MKEETAEMAETRTRNSRKVKPDFFTFRDFRVPFSVTSAV